jgi:cyclohexadienyl dehydratase
MALVRATDERRFATPDALDQPGVRIAVNAGGHLERVARARFPHAAVEAVADNRAVLPRLADGTADAAVTDTAELRGWMRPGLRVLGPFSFDFKAYLLPADRADLALRVDEWMVAREADGYFNSERVRWLGPNGSMDEAQVGRSAVAGLVQLRLDLMPLVAAAKRASGAPIDDPVQEQRVIERVQAMSTRPERTAAVYRQLIEMAKSVQRNAPAAETNASLADLRDAIGRVDAQLVREVDREPGGSVEIWRMTLDRSVTARGIDPASVQRLAELLASAPG